MKQKTTRNASAFTLLETLVVIVVIMFLVSSLLLPRLAVSSKSGRISCLNNLKEIGVAYRLWAGDNGDRVPAQQTVTNGGWSDFLANADQGAICWTNYTLMANELGQSPKLVVCPSDKRQAAFSLTNAFDNTHLSYFVGVSANDTYPQSIQGGDRNLGNGPATYSDYGFSPTNGMGNDVAIQTNSLFKPVSWSMKMHSASNAAGLGDVLLGDGSGHQISSAGFRQNWLSHADPTTNWPAGHIPASPSIRLVFP